MAERNSFTKILTADTVGDEARFAVQEYFTVHVSGTFGGGTVAIEELLEDGTWLEIADTVKTAPDSFEYLNHGGNEYRFTLTGATAPSLKCSVKGKLQRRPGS